MYAVSRNGGKEHQLDGILPTGSGRKEPVRMNLFQHSERPLLGKADIEIPVSENQRLNDRLAPESSR